MSATSQVPCLSINWMPSSSIRLPCSIESTPATHGILDPLGAVGMRGDLAAGGMGLLDRRAQLFDRELRRPRRVAPRHDAARGVDLDHVDAVLDLRPDDVPHLVDAVGDLEIAFVGEDRHADLRRVIDSGRRARR